MSLNFLSSISFIVSFFLSLIICRGLRSSKCSHAVSSFNLNASTKYFTDELSTYEIEASIEFEHASRTAHNVAAFIDNNAANLADESQRECVVCYTNTTSYSRYEYRLVGS